MTLEQIERDYNLRAKNQKVNRLELHHIILDVELEYRRSSWSEYVAPGEFKYILMWEGPQDWRDDANMEGAYKIYDTPQIPAIETEEDIKNAVNLYDNERAVKYSRKFETDYFRHELMHHLNATEVKEIGGVNGLFFKIAFDDVFVFINETMVYVTKMPNYLH